MNDYIIVTGDPEIDPEYDWIEAESAEDAINQIDPEVKVTAIFVEIDLPEGT